MTTPTPAALEAARKFTLHGNACDHAWIRAWACTCSYEVRLASLAEAFDRFASDVLSNHWCEAHPVKPTLRHHQEDASDAP